MQLQVLKQEVRGIIMISCKLAGGLGNMMFQIAATSAAGWKHGDESIYNFNEHIGMLHRLPKEYENTIFRKLRKSESPLPWPIMEYSDHPYKNIPYKKHQTWYGYFQSEKYFNKYREKILDLFDPTEETHTYIADKYGSILNTNSVSIHIRRGDYIGLQDKHPILDQEYYQKALGHINNIDNILIFSDDPEWCKDNYDKSYTIIEEEDYISLYIMAKCKHNIIANSSFSWWGAWLNLNKDKIVIAPQQWFGPGLSHINIQDLIPEGWLTI